MHACIHALTHLHVTVKLCICCKHARVQVLVEQSNKVNANTKKHQKLELKGSTTTQTNQCLQWQHPGNITKQHDNATKPNIITMPSVEPHDLTPLPLAMQKVLCPWPHHINGLGGSCKEGMVDLSVHAKKAWAEAKHNMFVERGIDDAGGSKARAEAKHDVCGSIAEQEKMYIHKMFYHAKEMQANAIVAAKTYLERQAKINTGN